MTERKKNLYISLIRTAHLKAKVESALINTIVHGKPVPEVIKELGLDIKRDYWRGFKKVFGRNKGKKEKNRILKDKIREIFDNKNEDFLLKNINFPKPERKRRHKEDIKLTIDESNFLGKYERIIRDFFNEILEGLGYKEPKFDYDNPKRLDDPKSRIYDLMYQEGNLGLYKIIAASHPSSYKEDFRMFLELNRKVIIKAMVNARKEETKPLRGLKDSENEVGYEKDQRILYSPSSD